MIAGYWTDVEKTCSKLFKMPDDPENRCIVSVHYYTPWEFCVCTNQYNWGTEPEIKTMVNNVNKLKTTFVDNGIPVIVGEYGNCKGNDEVDRVFLTSTLRSSHMTLAYRHSCGTTAECLIELISLGRKTDCWTLCIER